MRVLVVFYILCVAAARESCPPYDPKTQNPERLRIVAVESYSEGLGSWRIAISELLALTRRLNATFVEPCVLRGQINFENCRNPSSRRLRAVFDYDGLVSANPKIMSFDDYDRIQETLTKKTICMHHGSANAHCSHHTKEASVHGTNATCPAHLAKQDVDTLEMIYYRRNGLLGIPQTRLEDAMRALAFAPVHTVIARHILDSLGFDFNQHDYLSFQWRSETKHKQLESCAEALIASKHEMLNFEEEKQQHDNGEENGLAFGKTSSSTKVLLISDLTNDESQQWAGIRAMSKTAIEKVLDQLHANNFVKPVLDDPASLEHVDNMIKLVSQRGHSSEKIQAEEESLFAFVENSRTTNITSGRSAVLQEHEKTHDVDLVFFSIWDAIIAANSRHLSTCRSCTTLLCNNCMWQHNYVGMIFDLRNQLAADHHFDNKTDSCWPATKTIKDRFTEVTGLSD